jgi:hypothetical protein
MFALVPMSKPTRTWLLDPTFPHSPAVPHLDLETRELAGMIGNDSDPRASGTWLVANHPEDDEPRFARSDTEAPTVRPGSIHAEKSGW